ncbi:hypothetical protein [Sporisorium scitamineum]|uniref:Uncharacterized protein n=1 Tax=Sporisorium scitamineum TaxID=49012 RepID=A0A0F7SAA4_9BASI|nr:hypothetical protein [Sporisorium scitamineum]
MAGPIPHCPSNTVCHAPSTAQAEAASTVSKTVAPTGPAATCKEGHHCNALEDITNFANFFKATIEDMEADEGMEGVGVL